MRRFLRAIDRDGERYLMLVFYCTIVFVIVTEVIRRFVFSYSSLWGEEVARYAFIYLGWVGASYAVKQRAHIRFDVVLQLLPRLRRHIAPTPLPQPQPCPKPALPILITAAGFRGELLAHQLERLPFPLIIITISTIIIILLSLSPL